MTKQSQSNGEHSRRILIIEDDRSMRKGLALDLSDRGYTVSEADSYESGLKALARLDFDLLITDLRLPEKGDGIRLVERLKKHSPHTPALIITAFGSIDAAVKAMRAGADDFVTKGFTMDELVIKIEKIFSGAALLEEKERLQSENVSLKSELTRWSTRWELIGSSPAMQQVRRQINEFARTDFTILVQGETGTGKELIARAIHRTGPRRLKPFVVINCSALPRELLESELFGHEKGAFTGANHKKNGHFEQADGGVLFLDEVGDLDYGLQAKVLRAIEYKEFSRIGGTKPVTIDVQILAATNRDLLAEVEHKAFREDLYYRLKVMIIKVPPLRERRDDIPDLARHFLHLFAEETGNGPYTLGPKALDRLRSFDWPGNVRELKNVLFRAAALARGTTIGLDSFDVAIGETSALSSEQDLSMQGASLDQSNIDATSYRDAQDRLEQQFVRDALQTARGSIRQAARLLGISRNTFKKIMVKANLDETDFITEDDPREQPE
ncbi:sigma-54-dependent Fis family transcriptional regulator [bacterium]|nr:sigma-54-dependent Fis family transcriptional regulator [bacterium]